MRMAPYQNIYIFIDSRKNFKVEFEVCGKIYSSKGSFGLPWTTITFSLSILRRISSFKLRKNLIFLSFVTFLVQAIASFA